MRSAEDRELSQWLLRRMGHRRYWFWTLAAKILPSRILCCLLSRVPDEEDEPA